MVGALWGADMRWPLAMWEPTGAPRTSTLQLFTDMSGTRFEG